MLSQPNPPLQPGVYHSYLVRMWQEHPEAPWRALAQSVQTGEMVHFANLESLWDFLQKQTLTATAEADGQATKSIR